MCNDDFAEPGKARNNLADFDDFVPRRGSKRRFPSSTRNPFSRLRAYSQLCNGGDG
jgi:hypothetical protein